MRHVWSLLLPLLLVAAPAAAQQRPSAGPELVRMEVRGVVPLPDGAHAVVLGSDDIEAVMPIMIGDSEGRAIHLRLAGRKPVRPLTHDLLEKTIAELGGKVLRVEVEDVRDGIFLGAVHLVQGKKSRKLDARPSDAIALALGAGAPIYVARKVIDAAGVDPSELDQRRTPAPLEGPASSLREL